LNIEILFLSFLPVCVRPARTGMLPISTQKPVAPLTKSLYLLIVNSMLFARDNRAMLFYIDLNMATCLKFRIKHVFKSGVKSHNHKEKIENLS